MKFLESYRGWQIYRNAAYYIAIEPNRKLAIDGVDLPDLKADILEAMR